MSQDTSTALIIIVTCIAPVVLVTILLCTAYVRFLHSFWNSAPAPMARGKAAKPHPSTGVGGSAVREQTATATSISSITEPNSGAMSGAPSPAADHRDNTPEELLSTLNPESQQLMKRYLPQVDYIAQQCAALTSDKIKLEHLQAAGRRGLVWGLAHMGDEPDISIDTLTRRHIKRSIIEWLCQVSPGFADGFNRITASDLIRMAAQPSQSVVALRSGEGKWVDRLLEACVGNSIGRKQNERNKLAEASEVHGSLARINGQRPKAYHARTKGRQ